MKIVSEVKFNFLVITLDSLNLIEWPVNKIEAKFINRKNIFFT